MYTCILCICIYIYIHTCIYVIRIYIYIYIYTCNPVIVYNNRFNDLHFIRVKSMPTLGGGVPSFSITTTVIHVTTTTTNNNNDDNDNNDTHIKFAQAFFVDNANRCQHNWYGCAVVYVGSHNTAFHAIHIYSTHNV